MLIKQPHNFIYRAEIKMNPVPMMPFVYGSIELASIIENLEQGGNPLPEGINTLFYPFVMDDRHMYACELDFTRVKKEGIGKLKVSIYNLSYSAPNNPLCYVNDMNWEDIPFKSELVNGLQSKSSYTEEEMLKVVPTILRSRVKRVEDYTISNLQIMLEYLK